MQTSIKFFDLDWIDIPDYRVGELAVCIDPQKRLGDKTYAVVRFDSKEHQPIVLGLFGDKEEALRGASLFLDILDGPLGDFEYKSAHGHITLRQRPPCWYAAELADLYVQPEYRGTGEGKLLVLEAVKEAIRRGVVILFASILPDNEPSKHCISAAGFKLINTVNSRRTNKQIGIWLRVFNTTG